MPTFNFNTKLVNKPDSKPKEIVSSDVNPIKYDYQVISNAKTDRTKTYYSAFFKSLMLFVDYKAKSYNILRKYDIDIKDYHYYICLYKDEVKGAIKLKLDYTGSYRIYTYNIIPSVNQDYNVDIEFIEKRDNPDCIIYCIR